MPSGWRDQFLAGGAANLKAREADVENEETQRLKSLVADLRMSNELLRDLVPENSLIDREVSRSVARMVGLQQAWATYFGQAKAVRIHLFDRLWRAGLVWLCYVLWETRPSIARPIR
jgi:hypothetical protein